MSSEAAILEQVPQILLVVLNIKPIANAEQPCWTGPTTAFGRVGIVYTKIKLFWSVM